MIIYILVPLHKQTSHEPSSRKTRGKILEIKKKQIVKTNEQGAWIVN